MNKNKLTGIYPISPNYINSYEQYLEKCFLVITSGIKIFQFRSPNISSRKKRFLLNEVYKYCINADVQLIINNDYYLLKYFDGAGVHIGRNDIPVSKIINKIGLETIVGFSCGSQLFNTKELKDYGISYFSLGSIFSTMTKNDTDVLSKNIINKYLKHKIIPMCLIGGIDSSNIRSVAKYKPNMIAISNGIFREDVDNIKKTIKILQGFINEKD
tara:strand:+ start:5682 stop:6323 length:642 start_codon:yes stop_codon:yes gene_type:complete